jgi:hypothetical protein
MKEDLSDKAIGCDVLLRRSLYNVLNIEHRRDVSEESKL